jgi:hypothetical protein
MSEGIFKPTEHPLLPAPSVAEVEAALRDEAVGQAMIRNLLEREERIKVAEVDPFRWGFELGHWADADRLLAWIELILFIFGGNRSGKSEYAAKRIVQAAVKYPDSVLMCLHESEDSSIETQQKLIWKYLPPEIKRLNDKRNSVFKVRYTQAGGFTEGKLVLPNRSEIHFVSYKQDPGAFEGWELGSKAWATEEPETRPGWAGIGAWADENMPLPWMKMLLFRLASRAGKMVWTFTPVNGMTPTIKDQVGTSPKTIESRPAELLSDRVNLPGLPMGQMPFIQEPLIEKSRVIYFFSAWNPFGASYAQIKKLCAGKPSGFVEIRAYGYSRDTVSRAFPNFSEINIVKESELPAVGTGYQVTDPAGARNWATLWARCAPGKPGDLYIYRDWPDAQRFGEWAVTSSNPKKFDGEPGPAQIGLGHGVPQMKKVWLDEETIATRGPDGVVKPARLMDKDPYRLRGLELFEGSQRGDAGYRMLDSGSGKEGGGPFGERALPRTGKVGSLEDYTVKQVGGVTILREKIFLRLIDPRAGRDQQITARVGSESTCIQDMMAQPQKMGDVVIAEPMYFQSASGVHIREGVIRTNEFLAWNSDQPLCRGINAPRLFVSERCQQLIWALQNWTGEDGDSGACKDFIDDLRYLVLEEPRHMMAGMLKSVGGGSY